MSLAEAVPQSEASAIAFFMGLARWRQADDLALVRSVERGLPVASAKTAVARIDPAGRFLKSTDLVPKATLARREKGGQPLSRDESERIWALAKVFAELTRIYHGDADRAAQFMARRHPLLGGRTPVEVAKESIAGADFVIKLLQQAEAGVAV